MYSWQTCAKNMISGCVYSMVYQKFVEIPDHFGSRKHRMIPHEPWRFPMNNGHFTIINSIHFGVPQKLRYIVDTSTYIASHWLLCNHVVRCMWCRLSSPIVGQLCLDFASYFHKTIDFSGYPMSAVSITLNYCYFSVLSNTLVAYLRSYDSGDTHATPLSPMSGYPHLVLVIGASDTKPRIAVVIWRFVMFTYT